MHINSFYDIDKINEKVGEIVQNYNAFDSKINGIHTYSGDVTNGGNTLVYQVEKDKALSDLQRAIVEEISPYRSPGQEKYLRSQGHVYNEKQEENMGKFGYPYGPNDWDFHCSIASVRDKDLLKVKTHLDKYNKSENWKVDSVGVYVQQKNGMHKLYQQHRLRESSF